MKKKIVGILVCMVLITTAVLPVVGRTSIIETENNMDSCIELEKQVWDPSQRGWVEEIEAVVCTEVDFKITFTNCGDTVLSGPHITDTLPNGLVYVDGSASAWPQSTAGGVIEWYLNLSMMPGDSETITFSAHVNFSGELINWAEITIGSSDGDISDKDYATVIASDKFMGIYVFPLGVAGLKIGTKMIVSGLTNSGNDGVMADVSAYNAYECIVEDALQSPESSIKARITGTCNGFFDMALTIGSGYSYKAGFDGAASSTPIIIAYGRWPIRDILFMGIINVLDNCDNLGVHPVSFNGTASGAPSIITWDADGDINYSETFEEIHDLGTITVLGEYGSLGVHPVSFNGTASGAPSIAVSPGGSNTWRWVWAEKNVDLEIRKLMIRFEDKEEPHEGGSLTDVSITTGGVEEITMTWHYAYDIDPPIEPRIDGPSSGETGTEYTYTISNIGTQAVNFYIDWGDGNQEWTSLTNPAASVTAKHTWDSDGTYTIKARGMNKWGGVSNWATLEVSMPKNKAINTPFLQFLENLLQSHPHLFPVLQQLLQLGL